MFLYPKASSGKVTAPLSQVITWLLEPQLQLRSIYKSSC